MWRRERTIRRNHVAVGPDDEDSLKLRQPVAHAFEPGMKLRLSCHQRCVVLVVEEIKHAAEQRKVRLENLERVFLADTRRAADPRLGSFYDLPMEISGCTREKDRRYDGGTPHHHSEQRECVARTAVQLPNGRARCSRRRMRSHWVLHSLVPSGQDCPLAARFATSIGS